MGDASAPSSDFAPTASWQNLQLRARLFQKLRQFFDDRGFLEVDTPVLSADTVVDLHLDPLSVVLPDDVIQPTVGKTLWLQTSPEFAMKRLLAAGASKIYQITRAFRAGEVGRLHNPEFTIVEWYRTGDSMQDGMRLLSELAVALLGRKPARLLSYHEAFDSVFQVDPHVASLAALQTAAEKRSIDTSSLVHDETEATRDEWLNLMLACGIEPTLGKGLPTILYDYPESQAALAQVRAGNPPVAERFELYVDGIELANGYHELLDADALVARNMYTNRTRASMGKPVLPDESRLLAAMRSGLPECCGVALGFDRVVMLAVGANHIAEVIPFPIDRA